MMEHRQVETFRIDPIPREFAYRLLGIRQSSRRPRASVAAMIDEEFAAAARLVEARAVMRFSHAGLPGSAYLPVETPLVAVVCTIGPALEARVTDLASAGDTARASVLDAIGSAAAEAVADRSNQLLCQLARPTDLRPAPRRSPGYGEWDIREQRALFDFVRPEEIGVRLTETCMMVPRKSVSYVVTLDAADRHEVDGDRCAACGDVECPYREPHHDLGCDPPRDDLGCDPPRDGEVDHPAAWVRGEEEAS